MIITYNNYYCFVFCDKVSSNDKKIVRDKCTAMCIQDLRPFNIVNGTGFQDLIKCCVEMGAKYGQNINLVEILPSARTISNNIENLMIVGQPRIKNILSNIDKMSITLDFSDRQFQKKLLLGRYSPLY